jgi:tmRNA-binding protein
MAILGLHVFKLNSDSNKCLKNGLIFYGWEYEIDNNIPLFLAQMEHLLMNISFKGMVQKLNFNMETSRHLLVHGSKVVNLFHLTNPKAIPIVVPKLYHNKSNRA